MKKITVVGLIVVLLVLLTLTIVCGVKYYESENAIRSLFTYSNVIDLTGDEKVYCVNGGYELFVEYMTQKGFTELQNRRMGLMVFFEKDNREIAYILQPEKKYTIIYREDYENIP